MCAYRTDGDTANPRARRGHSCYRFGILRFRHIHKHLAKHTLDTKHLRTVGVFSTRRASSHMCVTACIASPQFPACGAMFVPAQYMHAGSDKTVPNVCY